MLALSELMVSHLVMMSQVMDAGKSTMGQVARVKASCGRLSREVVGLAREVCGGNGILL